MKVEQTHIDQIQKQFALMQTKEDLVALLSEANLMLYGEKCLPVQLKSLTYYANPDNCKKRYKKFTIKKKSGTNRTINAPVKGLKSILRTLNFVLQCIYEPHEAATGFVMNKSIVDNAKKHVGTNYVYNIDLKDFFHSFDIYRVKFGILKEIFGIVKLSHYRESNPEEFKTKEELAFLIASLTTHPFEIDGKTRTVLPQGSPTSPTLTNILCINLDRRLNGLAKRFNVTYTRYADDITFSSSHNIYNRQEFQDELKRIIEEDQKLAINPKKTRLQKECYRQEVTGLIVNDKVNVKRRYVKQIRMYLYYWEKYGYNKATEIFAKDYHADKSHVKKNGAKLENVLEGKLLYFKMVKGKQDATYNKLKSRFDKLNTSKNSKIIEHKKASNPHNSLKEEIKSYNKSSTLIALNENKVELIVRPFNNAKRTVLEIEKYLPKGLKIPYREKFENITETNKVLPSNPKATNDLLTKFKDDGSGFKELVHKPFDKITPLEILDKVKNHPNFSAKYNKGRKSGFVSINLDVHNSTTNLIDSFEKLGLEHWNNFNEFPFGEKGSIEYTRLAKKFKKNYRFGPKQEGYTSLQEMIRSTFESGISRFEPKIKFLPDERRFNLRSSFYTWVPSIVKGLEYIARGINEHSNINGSSSFDEKEIQIGLKRDTSLNTISLWILDPESEAKRPVDQILNDLRMSEASKRYFRSICDWSVHLNNSDGEFTARILKKFSDLDLPDIAKSKNIEGFNHELTFYGT